MKTLTTAQRIVTIISGAVVVVATAVHSLTPAGTERESISSQTLSSQYNQLTVLSSIETTSHASQIVNKVVNDVPNSVEASEPVKVHAELEYTEEDLEILAIIIYQEAGGDLCSDDTRRKVGSVFLNRVNSPLFPDTFEEVATAKKQYGTLYVTGIKWPDRAVYEQEAHAVDRAYSVAEELLIGGSILPDNVIWQAEFPQGDGTHSYQDGIYFCYSEVS